MVFKCFKYIFKHFSRSIGGWISLGLITTQIGLSLTFFLLQSKIASKYIYELTSNYIRVLKNKVQVPPKKRKFDNRSDKLKSPKKDRKDKVKSSVDDLIVYMMKKK